MDDMKAIVLAGGTGTRLRPLSLTRPKPMVRLLDRPMLEHLLLLLRRCGFTDVCITLQYLPEQIRSRFGDGSSLGLRLTYRIEEQPLGTAGAVRSCAAFIGDEPVLVISADAACGLDLCAFAEFQAREDADAAILVQENREPKEYGLVLHDADGVVTGFLEKPSADRLYTDLVNTGIYLLHPRILGEIPEGRPCDFGSELFPRLVKEGRRILVWRDTRYWNDVGSCRAYLQTCRDVLDGRLTLSSAPSQRLNCTPPCYIAPDAVVASGAHLGPYAVIGPGSRIGDGCAISDSVIDGAVLEADCAVQGSILCPGVHLGAGCQVLDGCVLADGVRIGAGSVIGPDAELHPGLSAPAGSVLTRSVYHGGVQRLSFLPGARMRGEAATGLDPGLLLRMGGGSYRASRCGAASCGGDYAALLADAFLIGCGSAGRQALRLDAETSAEAAACAPLLGLELTLFVRQSRAEITLSFFDGDGLPISGKQQRELEAAVTGVPPAAAPADCLTPVPFTGAGELHRAAAAACAGRLDGFRVTASGDALRQALRSCGAALCQPDGRTICLRLSEDGLTAEAVDERGRCWDWDPLRCSLLLAELRSGRHCMALPYEAPAAADEVARANGGRLYRLGRDEDAAEVWRKKPYARDGLFLCLRLCRALAAAKEPEPLASLMDALPRFQQSTRILPVEDGGMQALRELGRFYEGERVSGLRVSTGDGSFHVTALDPRRLRIVAESQSMEAAAALCEEVAGRIGRPQR